MLKALLFLITSLSLNYSLLPIDCSLSSPTPLLPEGMLGLWGTTSYLHTALPILICLSRSESGCRPFLSMYQPFQLKRYSLHKILTDQSRLSNLSIYTIAFDNFVNGRNTYSLNSFLFKHSHFVMYPIHMCLPIFCGKAILFCDHFNDQIICSCSTFYRAYLCQAVP